MCLLFHLSELIELAFLPLQPMHGLHVEALATTHAILMLQQDLRSDRGRSIVSAWLSILIRQRLSVQGLPIVRDHRRHHRPSGRILHRLEREAVVHESVVARIVVSLWRSRQTVLAEQEQDRGDARSASALQTHTDRQ